MYICYVDESQDERFAVMVGVLVPANTWSVALAHLKEFRQRLKMSDGIYPEKELHAWKFVSGRGRIADNTISIERRCRLFTDALRDAATIPGLSIITASSAARTWEDALGSLLMNIHRVMRERDEFAMIIFDRGNEGLYTKVFRRTIIECSRSNPIECRFIEDPIFQDSAHSLFIQLADFCAYALLRQEHPLPSKSRHGLDEAFDVLRDILTD